MDVLYREDVMDKMKSIFLYRPITNVLTLGIYSYLTGDSSASTEVWECSILGLKPILRLFQENL